MFDNNIEDKNDEDHDKQQTANRTNSISSPPSQTSLMANKLNICKPEEEAKQNEEQRNCVSTTTTSAA